MPLRCAQNIVGTIALLVAVTAAPAAGQSFPGLTATFVQPTGIVTPIATIEVWVRLTLAPDAAPLQFDGRSPANNFGLPAGVLPISGTRADGGGTTVFASYTSASIGLSTSCIGATAIEAPSGACNAGPYSLRPAFQPFSRSVLTIAPGGTFDFLFGMLVPVGDVAPGTYVLRTLGAFIAVNGLGFDGNRVFGDVPLASTCATEDPACAFSRPVVAAAVVP